jgi:hypothetical protein
MDALPRNIILKELEHIADHHLADILNYIQFLRASQKDELDSSSVTEGEQEHQTNAYPTINLNKPDYIIVTNHLN